MEQELFTIERLLAYCVEKSLRSDQHLLSSVLSHSTYAQVWESFSKWVLGQMDVGRAVNVPSFGVIGYHIGHESPKTIYVQLSEAFILQYALSFRFDDLDTSRQFVPGPSIKLNYVAVAKTCSLDKNVVNTALTNIFTLIGEILADFVNVEINLGSFGRFSSVERRVIFQPRAQQKSGHTAGRSTVKNLLEQQTRPKMLAPLATMEKKLSRQVVSEKKFKTLEKGRTSGTFSQVKFSTVALTPELLGAGTNPRARKQDFSNLLGDPKTLMRTSFMKPALVAATYPPVIDVFSRTLAAPISSLKTYIPPSARIASNYTPSAKSLIIDAELRSIRFIQDEKIPVLHTNLGQLQRNDEQRKQVVLKRYYHYIENEINQNVVAPIRQYWVTNILSFIPADMSMISKETIEQMIDNMLNEINKSYFVAGRKSILDYILKDTEECKRIGIEYNPDPPIDYGTQPYQGIEPDESWQNNVLIARIGISDSLCICSMAILGLKFLWTEYESTLFVDLPRKFEILSLQDFIDRQTEKISKVKEDLVSEWMRRCVQIIKTELDNTDMDRNQANTFFDATCALMSNQLRGLITDSVAAYLDFFRQFKRLRYYNPQEMIAGKAAEWPNIFLELHLTSDNGTVAFATSPEVVKSECLRIVKDIVAQSHNIKRPENEITTTEKEFLWAMNSNDEIIEATLDEIENIIDENLQYIVKSLEVYESYQHLAKERKRIDQFVKEEHTREEYLEQIQAFEAIELEIRRTCPVNIRMNMAVVECQDLNKQLCKECDEIVNTLTKAISLKNIEREQTLNKDFENMQNQLSGNVINEEKLVQIEDYIGDCINTAIPDMLLEYDEIKAWLKTLYCTSYHVGKADLDDLRQTLLYVNTIQNKIDESDNRLREERDKFCEQLKDKRNAFGLQISEIENEIQVLYNKSYEASLYKTVKKEISEIKEKIRAAEDEMAVIHEKEEKLSGGTISEFNKLEDAKVILKPLEDLWNLIEASREKKDSIANSLVVNINPEELEKEIRTMLSQSAKLLQQFKGHAKQQEIAEQVQKELRIFKEDIPIMKVVCTEGMNKRHWVQLANVLGAGITEEDDNPYQVDENTKYKQLDEWDMKDNLPRLEEIAERAYKEHANFKTLEKMEAEWTQHFFELKPWGETNTFILSGAPIEDIQTCMDDHILKVQTMKGSPYAKVFEKEILTQEAFLKLTQQVIDVWLKVQNLWLYLEPVFASNDIKKQLPKEAQRFQEVDDIWKKLMEQTNRDTLVQNVMATEGILENLTNGQEQLEIVHKELQKYLETKSLFFPRFFFLSNEDLLSILKETRDPKRVQPHLKKCFEGIKHLQFDEEDKISAMFSVEEEKVKFVDIIDTVLAEGAVERWLVEVENQMLKSVREMIYEALTDYPTKERHEWVLQHTGQAVLCVSMIFWTMMAEKAMEESGVLGLKQFLVDCNTLLHNIVDLVRSPLTDLGRCTLKALIVIDVHAKDVIGNLVAQGIENAKDFSWQQQLRYYWENTTGTGEENKDVLVRIVNGNFSYNYEYLGNSERLVITQLTDRCYLTLCGAVQLMYGGAPEGPAGTGKTETVKDLAKALARQCVVFNCSDGLDEKYMGKFFKGLASSGAWSCFDEFNRIDPEVLSVIAQQLLTIQEGIKSNLPDFEFEGTRIRLKPTCNCFITMNPGYAGRSDLPDNLKALFRTVAMMVPDYAIIAENVLYSYGFKESKMLAQKIVSTYTLCSEQLSNQSHYDYGMRAVKSVLVAAGNLKRKYFDSDESEIMLRAINDVNLAKFLSFDLPLFEGITSDLFPGVVLPEPDYKHLLAALNNQIRIAKLQPDPYFMKKIIQLYEMIIVRHGLMIVGFPFSGKTCAINVLKAAITECAEKGQMGENTVTSTVICPKSITMNQLYGSFDPISKDWKDGVLAVGYKKFARMDNMIRKWLIFDGPIDALWIESMNTVLDDNKKLCLTNGEIVAMSNNMNLIFQTMDLNQASPATVSRCGMVYLEPHEMGCKPLFDTWRETKLPKTFGENDDMEIQILWEWIIAPVVEEVMQKLRHINPVQEQNLVQSLMRLWQIQLQIFDDPEVYENYEEKVRLKIIDSMCVFATIWSVGACVVSEHRRNFDIFLRRVISGEFNEQLKRRLSPPVPDKSFVFDYIFTIVDNTTLEWKHWQESEHGANLNQEFKKDMMANEIVVPTIDTVRYTYLLQKHVENYIPILLCGNTGTGKTIYVKDVLLNKLSKQSWVSVEFGMSAQTTENSVQEAIDAKFEVRQKKGIFMPGPDKSCAIFVDDLNMPEPEVYQAQPPIEILRQLLSYQGWYDVKDCSFRKLLRYSFVSAMGPRQTFITPRMTRHLSLISLADFDDETLLRIFSRILEWNFAKENFAEEVTKITHKIIAATMDVYKTTAQTLLPTPLKSHYTFNLRDFSKVIMGICQTDSKTITQMDEMVRMWAHEIFRVFGDRLTSDDDRLWLLNHVRDLVRKIYSLNFDNTFTHLDSNGDGKVDTTDEIRGLLFGYLLAPIGAIPHYEPMNDIKALQANCNAWLEHYNNEADKPMDLVLFEFALEHLSRISRIIKLPNGNALLVGVGGSGRQSLTRLATYMAEFHIIQIEITRQYGKFEWREDLKKLLIKSGAKGEPTVFLFNDSQIKDSSFLEDINTLLNTGEVPNIFPNEEKVEVLEITRQSAHEEGNKIDGDMGQMYTHFVDRCKKNLHIVLCFSPIGEAFRTRLRNFPSLVNCTTINWFSEWPQDALSSVSRYFLSKVDLTEEIRNECSDLCQMFHRSTIEWSDEFLSKLKRHYYVTPTSYLEMITTFISLLNEYREKVMGQKQRYEIGLEKIIDTETSVEGMKTRLNELYPQLEVASAETEKKMAIVEAETSEAEVVFNDVAKDEAVAAEAADAAKEIKDECEAKLSLATPILNEALEALKCLDPSDMTLLKTMQRPPQGVKDVMEAVCILLKVEPAKVPDPKTGQMTKDYWKSSLKLTNDREFLNKLLKFDKEHVSDKTIAKLQRLLKIPTFKYEAMIGISVAAAGLCKWVIAIESFHHVYKIVAPKQAALAEANQKYSALMSGLAVKQKEKKVVQDRLEKLNADLTATRNNKEDLERRVELCKLQLHRAEQLILSLGGEKTNWTLRAESLGEVYTTLTGDILLSSGIVAYLGPFTAVFRNQIIDEWQKTCQGYSIPFSPTYNLQNTLGDPVAIRNWNIDGLPRDAFSIENGIIIQKARRWPLLIDPQGQANKWIKQREKNEVEAQTLYVFKPTTDNFMKIIATKISYGVPALLENVGEDIDPALEPILLKQIVKGELRMPDGAIEYNNDFRFYMTTKLTNPHYLPETTTKVQLINFMITKEGLADQLLATVVAEEQPELARKKEELIMQSANNKEKLKNIEEKILFILQTSTGNILDDDEAIQILSESKVVSNKIEEEQKVAEETEIQIDEARMLYKPNSQKTSLLFFCITELNNINSMYQYSLEFFSNLYKNAIIESEASEDLDTRLSNLENYFLYSLYKNICRSLFEQDKLLFSFMLTITTMEAADEVNDEELRFFMTGGIGLDEKLPPKPDAPWVLEKMWAEIIRLSKLSAFSGFYESFADNVADWKTFYDSPNPHECQFPEPWHEKLNLFEKMLVVRCIRPDSVIPAISNFVENRMGSRYVNPPDFDLKQIYKDSNVTTPLIFVLSSGAAPFAALKAFADASRKEIFSKSLGKGQGPAAEALINKCIKSGDWVLLQNCHLAVSWMPTLEKIVANINPDKSVTDRNFRLWLTAYPTPTFPVSILQNGIKMTREAPKGLRYNLRGSFTKDPVSSQDFFNGCTKDPEWKKLLFGLCFFNAVIQERRNYGPLGWNIPYEFTESDLQISLQQLQMFLNEYDKVPFKAILYLTGECNFGGRVTEDKDRRLIRTLIADFYTKQIFNDDYKFSESGTYFAPKHGDYESYLDYIDSLPARPDPEVYGLHSNADITKNKNETNLMFNSLMLTRGSESSGQSTSIEETVISIATNIFEDLPNAFDTDLAAKKYPTEYSESMNTVLTQELQRFNELTNTIKDDLKNIEKAFGGFLIMSTQLEQTYKALFDGKVPNLWKAASYPTLKPLGSYIQDLKLRLEFFKEWFSKGQPEVFNITRFYSIQSFLTGVLQNYARAYTIPIDTVMFDFHVIKEHTEKPKDGVHVNGMFIEGARWDSEAMLLAESEPKVLFTDCPMMWFKPVTKQHEAEVYECPVYKTSERKGVLKTTGHSSNYVISIRLPSDKPQQHWIKRGVAVLTMLDD